MRRTGFRILVAILVATVIWWVGPLISIGVYRPIAPRLLRQILVSVVLIWGFWPILARLWVKLSLSPRRLKPAPKTSNFDPVSGRIHDLDRQLRARWLREPHDRWQRWTALLARRHRDFLPWYLVLGADGAGKTSLIARTVSQSRPSKDGASIGAPRDGRGADFDFRIAQDAVWLDTSGRWTTRDSLDEAGFRAWKQLLHGLRRLRGTPVINGVVLCVDVSDLLKTSLESRKRLGDAARARLVELRDSFGQQQRVYVALTGLDKLDGAASMLALMNSGKWGRGMGFSLPDDAVENDQAAADAMWHQALQNMERRVQQQVLFSAPAATDVASNQSQLRFVEALGRLHDTLLALLHGVFAPGEGDMAARLRGVWLGSVAELVDASVSGSDFAREGTAAATRQLADFWSPLFRQAIAEQAALIHKGGSSWRSRLGAVIRWTAVAVFSLLAMLWLGWGYLAERDQLEHVWAQFSEGRRLAQAEASNGAGMGSPLLDIAAQMRYAQAQAEDAGRNSMGTSYFEHARVVDAVIATYHRHLQKMLMPELYNEVQRTLRAQTRGAPGDIYLTLKVYLMLCRPARRSADDLERWIANRWANLSGGQFTDDDRRLLVSHVRELIALDDVPATPEDPELVREARARAVQIPAVTRVLEKIRGQGLPAQVVDIALARAAGFGAAMSLRMRNNLPATDVAVSGWYSRAGYTDVFLPRLEKSALATLEEESWVLRDEPLKGNSYEIDGLVQKLVDATRRQFLQDYIANWQNFLNDVTVRGVTGLDDASQLAAAMIDPQSPLANLLRFAGRETTLTGTYEGDIDSWIDRQKYNLEKSRRAVVGEINGEHYRTVLLPEHIVEEHFQAVRQLGTQLTRSGDGTNNPLARLFEPLYRQLGLVNGALNAGQVLPAQYDAFTRLREEAARQPEPVRGIMLDLIKNGSTMTTRQSGALLKRGAAGVTRVVCDQGLTGHYPFRRGASSDAGVEDFERLFGPQGLMASYFRDHLANYVDTASLPWRALHPDGGEQSLVDAGVLRSYETADRIRMATLNDAGHLHVSMVLRFLEMDPQLAEAQLDIAGQTLRYAHGVTVPKRIDWTDQNTNLAIRLHLRSVDGHMSTMQFDGPWAPFRFFDAGLDGGGTVERRERLYQSSIGTVRMEWQTSTTPSPIWSGLLSSFRCPV